jgi:hypothetical protein
MVRWWVVLVVGAAVALLFAWLGRVAGVSLEVLLSIGAAVAALTWMVVLVTVPWNLYFAARQIVAEAAVSRRRGIDVRPDEAAEAERIARRMLRFAIGAHVLTALLTAVAAYVLDVPAGYCVAGLFLLSTVVRPAAAYLAHLRHRLTVLGRETTHPRDDVVTLKADLARLGDSFKEFRVQTVEAGRASTEDAGRTASHLRSDLGHLRQQVTADLARLESAQAEDRAAIRSGDDELRRTIEQMVRRIDAALDGVSDHQELLTGIRALVRMIRADAA